MIRVTLLSLLGICHCASLAAGDEGRSKTTARESNQSNSPTNASTLAECIDGLWEVTWQRFYLPRTHLCYDYLTSYQPGRELAHLPTADEIRRQYPNECGYGTGMEDGMISAGVMLSLIVDRYAVTRDEALRQRALDVFEGKAVTRLDCERVSSCGIFYLQAAYWKARRRTEAAR